MAESVPSFVIKYTQCREASHSSQKLNLICLNRKCQQAPLICSLCCLEKHKGHEFRPLKIHLNALYQRYSSSSQHSQELAELQARRDRLLIFLKKSVESIADQISRLEEAIQRAYERIKEELQQNEWRRNRFSEFYLSIVKDNYGDLEFQLKNYLFQQAPSLITDANIFQDVTKNFISSLSVLTYSFQENSPSQPALPLLAAPCLLPPNISRQGDVFWQSNFTINAPQLCLLDEEINHWQLTRLTVTVLAYGPFSYLAFGIIKKEEFEKANFIFKDNLSTQYFSSDGKGKGVPSNFLTNVAPDTSIDFSLKKSKLKVATKTITTAFTIPETNAYLFFVIEGNTKIKMTFK